MLVYLILSQRSLRLSLVLLILFTLFCSSEVISTILSSSSLIHSASDILLLIPSRVFLILVIVLFVSVCLFFNSSRSFVNSFLHFLRFVFKVFDHPYYHYSEFYVRKFAYFLSFTWTSVFLVCSFICLLFLCLFIILF